MRHYRGAALVTTLIILAAIGIMLSTIIYITRQYAKTAGAINYGDVLRQSAYVAMLENEMKLIQMPLIKRMASVDNISQLGEPVSGLSWIEKTYPDPQIKYYAYARGYVGYIPNELSMFNANGSYIYSLFSKTAKSIVDKGFVYHESFWLNPPLVSVVNTQKIQVRIPNVDTMNLSAEELGDYTSAIAEFQQDIVAEIKGDKIFIKSKHKTGYYALNQLCSNNNKASHTCNLTDGWINNDGHWAWVIAVYSEKGVYLWLSDKKNTTTGVLNPDISITLDGDSNESEIKNMSIISNLNIIRLDGVSYILYVEKTKEKTQLVMRDVEDGKISNKANLSVSSVGSDKFWITPIDINSDLSVNNIFIFGDKEKFGVVDIVNNSLSNMKQKSTLDVADLVQPLIISPADMYGNQFWITAVTTSKIITYFSDNSDFTNVYQVWQKTVDNTRRTLIYGGLLFIQNNNGNIVVLQVNNGKKFAKYNNIGSEFYIKSDFENKVMSLISAEGIKKISNRKVLFMREGLKQVASP